MKRISSLNTPPRPSNFQTGVNLRPNTTFKGYSIAEKIYSSENSIIFQGFLGSRAVAIKIATAPQSTNPHLNQEIIQEEKILRDVADHPAFPEVIEAGVYEDRNYLITTFLFGQTLAKSIDTYDFSLVIAINVLEDALSALDYLHNQAGVAHCDIKPENIIYGDDGYISLLDLGIAQALKTKPNSYKLTPRYAAPEQFELQQVGQRTDFYSLGLVFYEIISGQPPHENILINSPYETFLRSHKNNPPIINPKDFRDRYKRAPKKLQRKIRRLPTLLQTILSGMSAYSRKDRLQVQAIYDLINQARPIAETLDNYEF
ncbi:MAG: serine/threonine protein kinase [Candidatus Margulisbacteria bacterium]|nr:serine/threonine protein kinase [Candidatus Margulisiibacteriota bacterium]